MSSVQPNMVSFEKILAAIAAENPEQAAAVRRAMDCAGVNPAYGVASLSHGLHALDLGHLAGLNKTAFSIVMNLEKSVKCETAMTKLRDVATALDAEKAVTANVAAAYSALQKENTDLKQQLQAARAAAAAPASAPAVNVEDLQRRIKELQERLAQVQLVPQHTAASKGKEPTAGADATSQWKVKLQECRARVVTANATIGRLKREIEINDATSKENLEELREELETMKKDLERAKGTAAEYGRRNQELQQQKASPDASAAVGESDARLEELRAKLAEERAALKRAVELARKYLEEKEDLERQLQQHGTAPPARGHGPPESSLDFDALIEQLRKFLFDTKRVATLTPEQAARACRLLACFGANDCRAQLEMMLTFYARSSERAEFNQRFRDVMADAGVTVPRLDTMTPDALASKSVVALERGTNVVRTCVLDQVRAVVNLLAQLVDHENLLASIVTALVHAIHATFAKWSAPGRSTFPAAFNSIGDIRADLARMLGVPDETNTLKLLQMFADPDGVISALCTYMHIPPVKPIIVLKPKQKKSNGAGHAGDKPSSKNSAAGDKPPSKNSAAGDKPPSKKRPGAAAAAKAANAARENAARENDAMENNSASSDADEDASPAKKPKVIADLAAGQ